MYACRSSHSTASTHGKKLHNEHHDSKGQQKSYHKVSDVVTDHKHHAKGGASHSKSSAAQHKKKQMAELKYRNQKNDGVFYLY